jgi:hypothetical protein
MRRALGVDAVDLRSWDGVPRHQQVAREEMEARWDRFRADTKERARLARQELMAQLELTANKVERPAARGPMRRPRV